MFLDRFPIRRCWVPPSSGPPCLPDWCACDCAVVFCGFRPPSVGPNLGLCLNLEHRKFPGASLASNFRKKRAIPQSLSAASLSIQVAEGIGCCWEQRKEFFIEGESQGLNVTSPPCSCISKLALMVLKETEEEEAQHLESTASASSEATAEVAACTSL